MPNKGVKIKNERGETKMRKISFLVLILILTMLFVACGGGEDETATRVTNDSSGEATVESNVETTPETSTEPPTKANYKERTIIIGTMHYPPFEIVADGNFSGPGTETVIEVFNRLGYDYEIQDLPWARMLEMMQSGDLDIITDVYITAERSEYLTYSKIPYGTFPQTFFTLKSSGIKFDGNLDSIKDYTIGITRGYAYGEMFDAALKNGEIKYDESDTATNLFDKLANSRVDIVADTSYTGNAMIKELNKENEIIMLEPYFDSLFSYIAVSKANNLDALQAEYDSTLREVIADGTLTKIFEKYDMGEIADIIIAEAQ